MPFTQISEVVQNILREQERVIIWALYPEIWFHTMTCLCLTETLTAAQTKLCCVFPFYADPFGHWYQSLMLGFLLWSRCGLSLKYILTIRLTVISSNRDLLLNLKSARKSAGARRRWEAVCCRHNHSWLWHSWWVKEMLESISHL